MAIHEHDREDLLREAVALVRRIALRFPGLPVESVVGSRKDGSLSLYWQPDQVFQFNRAGELRRLYWKGEKLGVNGGKLVRLVRERKGGRVQSESVAVDSDESWKIVSEIETMIVEIQRGLRQELACEVIGQHPVDDAELGRQLAVELQAAIPIRIADKSGLA